MVVIIINMFIFSANNKEHVIYSQIEEINFLLAFPVAFCLPNLN